jgi:uroporphyrinogen-III synthase
MAPRVLVTRQPEQAGELRAGLQALGLTVVEVPLIEIAPPADPAPLEAALRALAGYDWIAFTSANAVTAVADRLAALGLRWPGGARVASVGPATSAALADRLPGAPVALEPTADHRALGLLAAFAALPLEGARVLLPVSDRARDLLPRGLRQRGAAVDTPVAYRTLPAPDLGPRLARALGQGADLVTLASPSAVEAFVSSRPAGGPVPPVAVIGPVTEEAARAAGLTVAVVAVPSTAAGLVNAIRAHFLTGVA